MARIKVFSDLGIVIYIYGEKNERHHGKHVLVVKTDEDSQYGFDGKPIKGIKDLSNKKDRQAVSNWILSHQDELNKAWEDINNGIRPDMIK